MAVLLQTRIHGLSSFGKISWTLQSCSRNYISISDKVFFLLLPRHILHRDFSKKCSHTSLQFLPHSRVARIMLLLTGEMIGDKRSLLITATGVMLCLLHDRVLSNMFVLLNDQDNALLELLDIHMFCNYHACYGVPFAVMIFMNTIASSFMYWSIT
jgi:hypothetical protein